MFFATVSLCLYAFLAVIPSDKSFGLLGVGTIGYLTVGLGLNPIIFELLVELSFPATEEFVGSL